MVPNPLARIVASVMFTVVVPLAVAAFADPLLEPPSVNTNPGPEYQQEVRAGALIISLERTPQGRVWGAWTGSGDNVEAYFILATSDDGGATWSKPRVVIDPKDIPGLPPRYSIIGNLWCDPTGKLWLFFDQQMDGGVATDWYITCDNPDAEAPVWSKPVCFADGSTVNKPVVLKNGDWLVPVSLLSQGQARVGPGKPDAPEHQPGVHLYASTDQGKTWVHRGATRIPEKDVNHNEPMFVELNDGRLWVLIRTLYGLAESYSSDQGRTWDTPKPAAIKNPSTRFFLRRLASGRLLLVKNGTINERLPGRSHMTAFLSDDDGHTWSSGLLLDARNALSYPDGFEAPDGLINIAYDRNRHTDAEILLTTFREEDVLAGKFASSDARPPFVIDKARSPGMSQSNAPLKKWAPQAAADAKEDRPHPAFNGVAPQKKATDAALSSGPGGTWSLLVSDGSETKLARSADQGGNWSVFQTFNPGLGTAAAATNHGPTELIAGRDGILAITSTWAATWPDHWDSWLVKGNAVLADWSAPKKIPAGLGERSYLRNHIMTHDGRILVPFQYYEPVDRELTNPHCGLLSSGDGGQTWHRFGDIRLGPAKRMFGWTESNLIELRDGRLIMLIKQPWYMTTIYLAESKDGGKTSPDAARLLRAPTGGTMALFSLGGDAVAMIHNPNNRLALWVSFDGMRTWPYQRALEPTRVAGPKENMPQAHGFVSSDREWLHFAYIDDQRRAAVYSAKLPPLSGSKAP